MHFEVIFILIIIYTATVLRMRSGAVLTVELVLNVLVDACIFPAPQRHGLWGTTRTLNLRIPPLTARRHETILHGY